MVMDGSGLGAYIGPLGHGRESLGVAEAAGKRLRSAAGEIDGISGAGKKMPQCGALAIG